MFFCLRLVIIELPHLKGDTMNKLVCFSPRLLTEEGVEKQFVNTRYINRITERGLNTIQLTLSNPNIEDILNLCDAFIITGGTDLDPKTYGEENQGLSLHIDQRLDEIDRQMIEHAVNHQKPLLGICRGHQSLNVFLGGTLHQDLDVLNQSHNRIKENHIIHMTSNPSFALESQISVNSYHHQAINKLAPSLKAIGTHEDGTIEMVIHENLPIFAVQWHPEITPDSPISKLVFDHFVSTVIKEK